MNLLKLSTFREEVEEFFDSMDRDFDGRLSFEEFMGEESPIEKLFKNMDKNGDGLVTKQVCKFQFMKLLCRQAKTFYLIKFLLPFHYKFYFSQEAWKFY